MTKDMINNGVNSDDKSRIIQEYVPGKQITLAHMVTRPKASVYKKLGLPDDYHDAIGGNNYCGRYLYEGGFY